MTTIAIIPARGGSKGLPRKNLMRIGGVPLVGRSVLAAKAARTVDVVYVSTDDQEISQAARRYGAEVIMRPSELSGDQASSEAALLHALEVLSGRGVSPEFVVFLQCTSPFTTSADIDRCVQSLKATEGAAASFAVTEDHSFLWTVDAEGFAQGVNHNSAEPRKRRQDLPPQFREAGSIYVMRAVEFQATRSRFCGKAVLVPVDAPPIEIDTEMDLQLCRAVYEAQLESNAVIPAEHLKALVMDFDGVMTDDRVLVLDDGREAAFCSRSDGLGLELLRKKGIELLILSRETNPIVQARARKLGIPVLNGILDKRSVLEQWLRERALKFSEVAYIGNDINDLDCLREVGWAIVPHDAHPKVRMEAHYITTKHGGWGAVREIADIILKNSRFARSESGVLDL